MPNLNWFSKSFHCLKEDEIFNNIYKNVSTMPETCSYTILWNANVRKWHKLCRNCDNLTVFQTPSISYWHCYRIWHKIPFLECKLAHRCVCHSLIDRNPGEFFIFQQNSTLPNKARDTVHITRSNSLDLKLMSHTTWRIINSKSTSCVFKMSMNWRSVRWSFGTWNIGLLVTGAFGKVV